MKGGTETTQKFPAGTQIGQFILQNELSNAGNMAWVYRASLRNDPHKQVVLKIAHADGPYSEVFEQLLRHEVRLLRGLRHPNIVHLCPINDFGRIFFVGRARELAPYCNQVAPWYFPMELLNGGSLEENMPHIQNFPLPWKLELIYQIAITIDHLHLRNIAHMDLKPSNIIFRYPPRPNIQPMPVLIDFGIAEKRLIEQEFKAATMMYASPERVVEITGMRPDYHVTNTQEVNNTAADVFALGIIAYEIITSKFPFNSSGGRDLLAHSILSDPPAPFPPISIPKEVEQMVNAMLIKQRDQRPAIHHVIAIIDERLPIIPPRIVNA